MATVAGTTTFPFMGALVVAVVCFLTWAAFAVRGQRATAQPTEQATPVPAIPGPRTASAPVRVVVLPHFTVAAPDAAAVRVAMAHRVRPPTPFPTPVRTTPAREEPAVAMPLPRSA